MNDDPRVTENSDSDSISVELSSRRTGMAFQRTRLAADRTLMSVIRTSLSLITFGFTIFQFFKQLSKADVLAAANSPRNFGIALVALGITLLLVGIVYHVWFMLGLRVERGRMMSDDLIHGESLFPPSMILFTAVILLLIGIVAILNMLFS